MTSTFNDMSVEHLGPEASEQDLADFVALCKEVQRLHPLWDDCRITDAVFGDGDYFKNARCLGVDVDTLMIERRKQKYAFTLTDNGRNYDCAIDDNQNGTVTFWIPYGICVNVEEARKIAEVLRNAKTV